jgi:hypothetical protein
MEDNATTAVSTNNSLFYDAECGYEEDVSQVRFWFAGVLVSVIALIGFVGNLLALVVLSRKGINTSHSRQNKNNLFSIFSFPQTIFFHCTTVGE